MIFYYGVQHFRKNKGCYGQPVACNCPVCMNGLKADKEQKKEIKQLLAQAPSNVHFTPHMVSYADKKTFDFYLQDDATGEKIRILQGVSKYEVKEEYKSRLIKKKDIVQEESAL